MDSAFPGTQLELELKRTIMMETSYQHTVLACMHSKSVKKQPGRKMYLAARQEPGLHGLEDSCLLSIEAELQDNMPHSTGHLALQLRALA